MDRCLDNINPTFDEVRAWAGDWDVMFTDQDEDLILYADEYVPILMELASDPACPKGYYCLTILAGYSRGQLTSRIVGSVNAIEGHIRDFKGPLGDAVLKWKSDFLKISNLIRHPASLTDTEAESIAFCLTDGGYREMDFKKGRILKSGYIEYIASTAGYREYLYINPQTSLWKFSRLVPVTDL
jgi:hypothetical protein